VEAALEENIEIVYLAAPLKIARDGKRLKLTCIRNELGEPDASGRRRPVPVEGSEFTEEYSCIIGAIGQSPEIPEKFDVKTGRGNTIQTKALTGETSRKGVWAGGDVSSGPDSVIRAIEGGRRAASSIDKYLGGDGVIDEELTTERELDAYVGILKDFPQRPRVHSPAVSADRRKDNFEEVELCLEESFALAESRRCFQCGIRTQLGSAPQPPYVREKV
jgi:hypothetical protein